MAKIVFFEIFDSKRKSPILTCTFDVDAGEDAWQMTTPDWKQNGEQKFQLGQIGTRNKHKLIKITGGHGEDFKEVVAVIHGNQTIQLCSKRYYVKSTNWDLLNVVTSEYDYKNDPDYKDVEWEE